MENLTRRERSRCLKVITDQIVDLAGKHLLHSHAEESQEAEAIQDILDVLFKCTDEIRSR